MKLVVSILLAVLALFATSFSQVKVEEAPLQYDCFFSLGYGGQNSKTFGEYYDLCIEGLNEGGVPIEKTTGLGSAYLGSLGVYFYSLPELGAGVSFSYSYSHASTSYGQYNVEGTLEVADICFLVRYIPYKYGIFPLILKVQVGASHASANFGEHSEDKTVFFEMSKTGWGPTIKTTVGSAVPLGAFNLALEAGYNYAWVESIEQEQKTSTNESETINNIMDIGLNGFFGQLTFSIPLSKYL